MKQRSPERTRLVPLDLSQRYTISEAVSYLRISHASIYKEINARRLRVIKQGKRTFIPGTEIARLSKLEGEGETQFQPAVNTRWNREREESTAYRLLDRRIHQALMKDIAHQQTLWDLLKNVDGRLRYIETRIDKLALNTPTNETRSASPSDSAQFLRLKEVTLRVGMRVSTIYRYIALGAFPKPRKFGRSSLWVATEVNHWIAQRIAGVPIEPGVNASQ